MKEWLIKNRMPVFLSLAVLIHLAAFIWIRFALPSAEIISETEYAILKLVDIEEYIPPPPPPEQKITMVYNRPESSEQILEIEDAVVETDDSAYDIVESPREPEYLPQHKISRIPEIPSKEILAKIVYPPMALRQGIEAVVYLELYIDNTGAIRRIQVLKDPGNGFAEAATAAIEGLRCTPAMANGKPVAVRFRYPVRFTLK